MAPIPDTKPIGTTGLNQFGGRLYEEYLRELQGTRWHRVLRQMVNQDPVIGAALLAMEMLIRQVSWTVVPANDSTEAEDVATFVKSCLDDMDLSWGDIIAEILSCLPFGWVTLELVYKPRKGSVELADGSEDPTKSSAYDDGKIGWSSWEIRAQETLDRWEFGDHGRVTGFYQIAPPRYEPVFIPLGKVLHVKTTNRKNSPEGKSLLRNSYRPWYFKSNIENVEGIGVERDLAGFPLVRIPSEVIDAQGPEYTAWRNVAINIKRDDQEGLVIPSDRDEKGNLLYDVTLLTSGGARQFKTDEIINRYNAQIAMTFLADFIVMGHEDIGSFALSSDKTKLFSTALGSFLEIMATAVERQAFRRLLRLNGIDASLCPTLTHGDIESLNLGILGNYLTSLKNSGMNIFPNPDLESFLLRQAGLPIPAVGYEPPEPPEPTIPAPGQGTPPKAPTGEPA